MNLGKSLVAQLLTESEEYTANIVGIYAGRFQPMGKHHVKTYRTIESIFGKGNAFIATSDKIENPKSPLSFKEKEMIFKKHGIRNYVKVKNPYKGEDYFGILPSKFKAENTALVFVVGKKDGERLSSKYFTKVSSSDVKSGKLKPSIDTLYWMEAPHISIKIPKFGEMSGTTIRHALSSDAPRAIKEDIFEDVFGWWDESIYNLIVPKFEKLKEGILTKDKIKRFVNEIYPKLMNSLETRLNESSTGLQSGLDVDDGPGAFFPNLNVFNRVSHDRAAHIGYQVMMQISNDKYVDIDPYPVYPYGPVSAVSFYPSGQIGALTAMNQIDTYGEEAYDLWKQHVSRKASLVGYSIISNEFTMDDDDDAKDDARELSSLLANLSEDIKKLNEGVYSYNCLMVNTPLKEWNKITSVIKKEDVYEGDSYGIETNPHITVLYGLHEENNIDIIKDIVKDVSEINFNLTGLTLFENEKFDVLKFDVQSEILSELNKRLSSLPHTTDYPDYHPHLTVAYLKKGTGKKYVKEFKVPLKYKTDEFYYSTANDEKFVWKNNINESSITELTLGDISIPPFKIKNYDLILNGNIVGRVFLSKREYNGIPYYDLSEITINEDQRGNKIFSRFMNGLFRLMDSDGAILSLTPEQMGKGGPSTSRLKDIYKKLGFHENKGKYKDFQTINSMIRYPKGHMNERMSHADLDRVEKHADAVLAPIDVEFTSHFFDRLNDPRNGKDITDDELIRFFDKLAKDKDKLKEFLKKFNEFLVKDKKTSINIPFVNRAKQIIAKTVMRKHDFKSGTVSMALRGEGIQLDEVTKKELLDLSTRKKKESFNVTLKKVDTSKNRLVFQVGKYDVVVKLSDLSILKQEKGTRTEKIKLALDGDIKVDCQCADFQYRYRYVASEYGATTKREKRPTNITNPNYDGSLCKHLDFLLRNIDSFIDQISNRLRENTELEFPLQLETVLNEFDFNPDIVTTKKHWYVIDNKDILKVSDNIIDLVKTAYSTTKDGSFVNNKSDIKRSFYWNAIDIDEYPDADAVIFGRKSPNGIKIQGIGHDGQVVAKKAVITKLIQLLNKNGYWVEASDALEHVLYKSNVPYVENEAMANSIFPNTNLKMIGDRGKYTRSESGKIIKETIFGKPTNVVKETTIGTGQSGIRMGYPSTDDLKKRMDKVEKYRKMTDSDKEYQYDVVDEENISYLSEMQILEEAKLRLNLPKDILAIHKMFKKNGKQLFVVGGAVRDAILGKSPKDFDLATDAKPNEVIKMAKKEGFNVPSDPIGIKFGIALVNGHEIATFRADIGKGRRPDAVEYTDIKGDVQRRDLTINALFYDIERKEIVDLVGGIEDLKNKRVRTVGDPKLRFEEDELRKLRALRFNAALGGKMDDSTYNALKSDPSLKGISPERIRDEFIKGLQKAKSTRGYLETALELGILPYILPNLSVSKPFIDTNDHILLLAYVLRKNDKETMSKTLNRLTYTTDEIRSIVFLTSMKDFIPEKVVTFKKMQKISNLTDKQILTFGNLIDKDFRKFLKFNLSVQGGDVMSDGFKGADIGNEIESREAELFRKS